MNNNDVNQLAMTHYVLRDYLAIRAQKPSHRSIETLSTYIPEDNEVLHYAVFTNPACPDQTAKTLIGKSLMDDYCRRWLYFYTPQAAKLPHVACVSELLLEQKQAQTQLTTFASPRLALFTVSWGLIVFLMARGHFFLTLLPILVTIWYWFKTETKVIQKRQQLRVCQQKLEQTSHGYKILGEQLQRLPNPTTKAELADYYERALASLVRLTITNLLQPTQLRDWPLLIERGYWPSFIVESWAALQLSLITDTSIANLLLAPEQKALTALVADKIPAATVYRLTYIQVMVMADSGLLLGRGIYDRVTDQFLHTQTELLAYEQLQNCQVKEMVLSEQPALKNQISEPLYQDHYAQPVQVLTINTTLDESYMSARPMLSGPKRETTLGNLSLSHDLIQFKQLLNQKIARHITTGEKRLRRH